MIKKISKTFLFMGMVALVALYSSTGAVAQDECEVPLSCTTQSGWTITLMDGYPMEISPDIYELKYSVKNQKGDTKGLNHINFSIPVCCPDPISILYSEPAVHIYLPPGTPDDTTGFGKGIQQIFVLKWSLNDPQDTDWFFHTNTKELTKGSVGLKVGNKFELCEIAVPGCPEPPPEFAQSAVNTMTYVTTVDGRLFKQMLDPATQCPTEIWEILLCGANNTVERDGEIRECTAGEIYEWLLEKRPSSEILTAQHDDYDPAGVTSIAYPGGGCGGAMLKSDGEHSWFLCFLGWCWY